MQSVPELPRPCGLLFHVVNHFHESLSVIEGFIEVQPDMRLNARIHAIKRTVAVGRDLQRTGNLINKSGSCRGGKNCVGTAAAALSDQGDAADLRKESGNQIAAGEGLRRNEAKQVILLGDRVTRIVFFITSVRVAQCYPVYVQVCTVGCDGFRTGHGIPQGYFGLPCKP